MTEKRLHLFGDWTSQETQHSTFPADVAAFLLGQRDDLDGDGLLALRREFDAQERYRLALVSAVVEARDYFERVYEASKPSEHPPASLPREHFALGRLVGTYETAIDAVQRIAAALHVAAEGTGHG